jgi:NAD+ kinase
MLSVKTGGGFLNAMVIYKNTRLAHRLADQLSGELLRRGIKLATKPCSVTDVGHLPRIDLAFVLGGDGTLLTVARMFAHQGTPILGVNLGTVGFLSSIEPDALPAAIDRILNGDYVIEQRAMIDVSLIRSNSVVYRGLALNEATIRTRATHPIVVRLYIGGTFYTNYQGDGVICATPTGSTAYSFAAGGPILDVQLPALVVTPLCPPLASSRSLVINSSPNPVFELASDYETGLSLDSDDCMTLQVGDRVQIESSRLVTRLIQLAAVSSADKVLRRIGNLDRRTDFTSELPATDSIATAAYGTGL